MAYLVVREPGRGPWSVRIGDVLTAGRDDECDLVLADRQASRRHLRLVPDGDGHACEDLSSTHGTFVNGARVTRRVLRDGDVIQLGNVLCTYRAARLDEASIVESVTALGLPPPRAGDVAARRLALLHDASRAISGGGDPDELAGALLDGAIAAVDAERGILARVERGGALRRVLRGGGAEELVLPAAIQQALLDRRESLLCEVGASSALATPLLGGGKALGFVFLTRRAPRFALADRDFLLAFGHLAGAALAQGQERHRLARVAEALAEPGAELLGQHASVRLLRDRLDRYAASGDTAVLIRGESGSGKEIAARLIHARSPRAAQPFVAVNCAAIPDTLIESELFGHEKGAFTGAVKTRRGKFALADGGTLFLDEVGDLSLAAQAKVLRAIEEGEILPIGSESAEYVDVRIVSATHKPLEQEIAAGRFRADLFYRLGVVELVVPPLRDRGDDIVLLATSFLERAALRLGRGTRGFSPAALATLRAYSWPGNVRQLANEVERALLLSDGELVDLDDLRARVVVDRPAGAAPTTFRDAERELVARALKESGGNIQATARALGVSRNTLYRKLTKYNLTAP